MLRPSGDQATSPSLPFGLTEKQDDPIQLYLEDVFTIPTSAVVQVGASDRLYVAAPTGRAEVRAISLAERDDEQVIVTQGLDVGDAVIVDVPTGLGPNSQITVAESTTR